MYRLRDGKLEVFLGHPGGPYYQGIDDCWSIPKGLIEEGEDLLAAAQREFEEETGVHPHGPFFVLGEILQKNRKTVYVWAFAGDVPADYCAHSNLCSIEWPPHSGQQIEIPEMDTARFFSLEEARVYMKQSQHPFLERLCQLLAAQK